MKDKRFYWKVSAKACEDNLVIGEKYRFTVITSRLIRLQYSENGCFEDRASQTVFYRDLGKTSFTVKIEGELLCLETEELLLEYEQNKPFSARTLSIRLKTEPASTWHYGDDFEDEGGTARTLDVVDDGVPLGRGVCSRWGFSVLDDSESLVLDESGWIEVRADNAKDVYFFGYGYDYIGAVSDFYRITGAPPLLPAYALGNWWSRYHKYTQQEYIDLMARFKSEDIPFSVAVIDMDWHIVDIPEQLREEDERLKSGWTGYSWNKQLFPDYKAFLRHLKENNLHTALNLHPAQGVRRHEDMYEQAAIAASIDPKSGKRVPLDVLSPTAMANYFDILHHPYEENGVDFWWMDWQQGTDYWWIHEPNVNGVLKDRREKLDPLWMLNHLHILDISRGGKRPMFFSRYAGPGSHRYPVGFSGDTRITWDALRFQPYFTATASNVGYCWWSHDIGGHMHGYRDDVLMTRWVQLGVFSPINRLHSTSNAFQLKEAWTYGAEARESMGKWLRFRHRLFPYIYTMNYRCHSELLPMVQPMYYSHPKCKAAYGVPNQFWFGSQLIVAPITEPNNKSDLLGRAELWLPKGKWFDFETGLCYHSENGRSLEVFRDIYSYPVFAKQGAIVPLCEHRQGDNRIINDKDIELVVFPGESNSFTLYEDAGEFNDYSDGACAKTRLALEWGKTARFTVNAAEGDTSLIPSERSWKISLRGFNKAVSVSVLVDGTPYAASTEWIEESNTVALKVMSSVASRIEVLIEGDVLIHDNRDAENRIFAMLSKAQLTFEEKSRYLGCVKTQGISLHDKIWRLGNSSPETFHTAKAIKELLTLNRGEFE